MPYARSGYSGDQLQTETGGTFGFQPVAGNQLAGLGGLLRQRQAAGQQAMNIRGQEADDAAQMRQLQLRAMNKEAMGGMPRRVESGGPSRLDQLRQQVERHQLQSMMSPAPTRQLTGFNMQGSTMDVPAMSAIQRQLYLPQSSSWEGNGLTGREQGALASAGARAAGEENRMTNRAAQQQAVQDQDDSWVARYFRQFGALPRGGR